MPVQDTFTPPPVPAGLNAPWWDMAAQLRAFIPSIPIDVFYSWIGAEQRIGGDPGITYNNPLNIQYQPGDVNLNAYGQYQSDYATGGGKYEAAFPSWSAGASATAALLQEDQYGSIRQEAQVYQSTGNVQGLLQAIERSPWALSGYNGTALEDSYLRTFDSYTQPTGFPKPTVPSPPNSSGGGFWDFLTGLGKAIGIVASGPAGLVASGPLIAQTGTGPGGSPTAAVGTLNDKIKSSLGIDIGAAFNKYAVLLFLLLAILVVLAGLVKG